MTTDTQHWREQDTRRTMSAHKAWVAFWIFLAVAFGTDNIADAIQTQCSQQAVSR